jgi:hypothetical protein
MCSFLLSLSLMLSEVPGGETAEQASARLFMQNFITQIMSRECELTEQGEWV